MSLLNGRSTTPRDGPNSTLHLNPLSPVTGSLDSTPIPMAGGDIRSPLTSPVHRAATLRCTFPASLTQDSESTIGTILPTQNLIEVTAIVSTSTLPPTYATGREASDVDEHGRCSPPRDALGWLLVLTCPFRWVYHFVFTDAIVPTDDFFTRVRKASMGGLLIAFLAQWFNILEIFISSPFEVSVFVFFAVTLPMTFSHVAGFLYCHVKKEAPDWLFGGMILTATACRCFLAMMSRSYDMGAPSFGFIMLTLCSRMPIGVEIAVLVLTFICLTINTINLESTGDVLLMFPGSSMKTQDVFKHLIGSRLGVLVGTVFFFIVVQHFVNILHAKDSAVKVSHAITAKLQHYDTEAAWKIVRGEDAVSQVDPELLKAFERIIENLERYRPFLPNYVFDSTAMNPSSPSGLSDGPSSFGAASSGVTPFLFPVEVYPPSSGGGGDISSTTPTQPFKSMRRRFSSMAPGSSSVSEQLPSTFPKIPPSSSTSPPPEQSRSMSVLHAGASASSPIPHSTFTVVSACVMSVHRSDAACIDFGTTTLWNAFVMMINDVAQTTGASLHSFLGDRLVATWNGTKRVSKPESRACQFSLRVRSAIEDNAMLRSGFKVASMVSTRQAECSFAGDSRLRLFVCSSPELWKDAYAGLKRIEPLHIAVVDRSTKESSLCDFVFRAAGLIKSSHHYHHHQHQQEVIVTTRRCIYELVQERVVDAHKDEEWMYALREDQSDPQERLMLAMELCAAGKTGEGLNKLQLLRAEHPEAISLVPGSAQLMEDMLRCEESPGGMALSPASLQLTPRLPPSGARK